jgi:hypothetical protein
LEAGLFPAKVCGEQISLILMIKIVERLDGQDKPGIGLVSNYLEGGCAGFEFGGRGCLVGNPSADGEGLFPVFIDVAPVHKKMVDLAARVSETLDASRDQAEVSGRPKCEWGIPSSRPTGHQRSGRVFAVSVNPGTKVEDLSGGMPCTVFRKALCKETRIEWSGWGVISLWNRW